MSQNCHIVKCMHHSILNHKKHIWVLKSSYGNIYANRHLKWEQNFSQVLNGWSKFQLWSPSESWCSRWSSQWICGVFFPSVPPSSPCHVASHGTPSLKWQIQRLRSELANKAKDYICIYICVCVYVCMYAYVYESETYAHQKKKKIITWNFITIKNVYFNIFIPVMQSWILSIITPVFSVTWSSEIIVICLLKKHFLLLSMLKIVVLLQIFETWYIFFQDSLMNIKFKLIVCILAKYNLS